jgi:hypothetical protein
VLSTTVELRERCDLIGTSTEDDDRGNFEATVDDNANRTEYEYDERNRQTVKIYAVGTPRGRGVDERIRRQLETVASDSKLIRFLRRKLSASVA